jgi:hypothetical protein
VLIQADVAIATWLNFGVRLRRVITVIPKEWLQCLITIADAESQHVVIDERLGDKPIPFGFMNYAWRNLMQLYKPGDELWIYRSSDESWRHLAGRTGIALVRDGVVIDDVVTLMN